MQTELPNKDDVLIGGARRPVPLRVRAAVDPIVRGLDLELVGVELTRDGGRQVLWVFLDKPEGLTLEDCTRAHPEISAALDVEDPIPESYELRVSSPGLDRPLFTAGHFRRFAGQEVIVQLGEAHAGRRKFTGKIGALTDDGERVLLHCQDGDHEVPLETMSKARLKFEMPAPGPKAKPGTKPKKTP